MKETDLKAYKKVIYKSKLDPYKEYNITNRVEQALPDKIPSTVIFEEIKKYGYDGQIRIIQTFIKSLQLVATPKEELIRFETKPAMRRWTEPLSVQEKVQSMGL